MALPKPPAGASGGKPPPEPGSDAPSPSLAIALIAAQSAVDACLKDGLKVSVAVVDASGQPRVALTADGATGGHIYTAVRKDLAAIEFRLPTSKVAELVAKDKSAAARMKPAMITWAGAVPLFKGDELIGAIGASGASGAQDELCSQAGADAIAPMLKQ